MTPPVVVVLGPADDSLVSSLRTVGLTPVATDGDTVIWGRPPPPPATPTGPPQSPIPTGPAGLLMTIADVAVALGIGRSSVYELIARRDLEVVHVGRSARVPTEALRAFVERLRSDRDPKDWREAV